MTQFITDRDVIDFRQYMKATDHDHKIIPAASFQREVERYFHDPELPRGALPPWRKLAGRLRFRPGEVTLWSGISGHGKSLALGQTATALVAQGERVCIASLEMKPVITLARMVRQASRQAKPTVQFIEEFHQTTGESLLLYDQIGTVRADKMLAVLRYCAQRRGVRHMVIDSLMKCGLAEDGYTEQKHFLDGLCTAARDHDLHVHLVAHARKGRDEHEAPGKMDVKGSGSIVDQVDNVVVVWRNKRKEVEQQAGKHDRRNEPDAVLSVEKQRNGEWEGRCLLWFDHASTQFVEQDGAPAMDLLRIQQ